MVGTLDFATADLIALTMAGSGTAVCSATVKALNRMRIKVASIDRREDGCGHISAVSGDRVVMVDVTTLGPARAQLKISARQGKDSDLRTAIDVIAQTEWLLARPA